MKLMNVLAVALMMGFPAVASAQTAECQKTDCQLSSQSQCTAELAVQAKQDCDAQCTEGDSCCQEQAAAAKVAATCDTCPGQAAVAAQAVAVKADGCCGKCKTDAKVAAKAEDCCGGCAKAALAKAGDCAACKTAGQKCESCAAKASLSSDELQALRALGYLEAEAQESDDPPFLGVYLDEGQAASEGVTLTGVIEGTAADKAGLNEGDVIVGVGDHEVNGPDALREALSQFSVGDKIRITFLRNGERHRTRATLGSRPDDLDTMEVEPEGEFMELEEIEEDAEPTEPRPGYLGVMITTSDSGVGISDVVDGSPAARAELRSGDVITSVNGHQVGGVEELVQAIQHTGAGEQVTLKVARDGDTRTVKVKLAARDENDVAAEEIFEVEEPEAVEVRERIGNMIEQRRAQAEERRAEAERRAQELRARREGSARQNNTELDELRAMVSELRAENMRLREALQARNAGEGSGGAGNGRARSNDMSPAQQRHEEMLQEMRQALRRQQQMLDEMRRKMDGGDRAPQARVEGLRPVDPVKRAAVGFGHAEGGTWTTDEGRVIHLDGSHFKLDGEHGPHAMVFVSEDGKVRKVVRQADGDAREVIELRGAHGQHIAPKVEVKDGVVRIQIGDEVKEFKLDGAGAHEFKFKVGDHGEGHAVIEVGDGTTDVNVQVHADGGVSAAAGGHCTGGSCGQVQAAIDVTDATSGQQDCAVVCTGGTSVTASVGETSGACTIQAIVCDEPGEKCTVLCQDEDGNQLECTATVICNTADKTCTVTCETTSECPVTATVEKKSSCCEDGAAKAKID